MCTLPATDLHRFVLDRPGSGSPQKPLSVFFSKSTPVVFVTHSQDCKWPPPLGAHFLVYAPPHYQLWETTASFQTGHQIKHCYCISLRWSLPLVIWERCILSFHSPTLHPSSRCFCEVKKTKVLKDSREPLDSLLQHEKAW